MIDDMHSIESTIFERLHDCEHFKYVISHNDVRNAVSHLKNGKSGRSEGLFSEIISIHVYQSDRR